MGNTEPQRDTEIEMPITNCTRCGITGCESPAIAFVNWGTSQQQHGNLCVSHVAEVYGRCKPLIETGRLFWSQSDPKDEHDLREFSTQKQKELHDAGN